jgi:hypothetical protein
METISIDLLTRKLKNAPQSVLERVVGYVDALIDPATNPIPFNLSEEQQQISVLILGGLGMIGRSFLQYLCQYKLATHTIKCTCKHTKLIWDHSNNK